MKYELYRGDCLELLRGRTSVKCIFADPPDNIGLKYEAYNDKKADADYIEWLANVVAICTLTADICWFSFNAKWTFSMGRIFENLICLHGGKMLGKACTQVFTFGQHNKNDFGNNHRPLWRLMWCNAVLYPEQAKVASWRQRNGDKRAKEGGRVPGDVMDMQYPGMGDVLDFPRVTGNSKQRCDWHPTQLHEEMVERCIRLSAGPGERVLDPFGGTGTTLRVCKKLGNPCTIFELDGQYCQMIAKENGLLEQSDGVWGCD